jgi:hypothetical protein
MSSGITFNFGSASGSRYQRRAQYSRPPPYQNQSYHNRRRVSKNYSYQYRPKHSYRRY